jgi:hypothetical protein
VQGLLKHYLVFVLACVCLTQSYWPGLIFFGFALTLGQSMLLIHQVSQRKSLEMGFPLAALLHGIGFLLFLSLGSLPAIAFGILSDLHEAFGLLALLTFFCWWALWPALLLKTSEKFQLWQAANWKAGFQTLHQIGAVGIVTWLSSFFFLLMPGVLFDTFGASGPLAATPLFALIVMAWAYWWGYQARVLRWGQLGPEEDEEGIGFTPL